MRRTVSVIALIAFSWAAFAQKPVSDQDEHLFILARTDMKAFAQKLTASEPSELGKVEVLVHWLVQHFDWKNTDYQKRTLEQIVERRGGNCNDFATVAIAA